MAKGMRIKDSRAVSLYLMPCFTDVLRTTLACAYVRDCDRSLSAGAEASASTAAAAAAAAGDSARQHASRPPEQVRDKGSGPHKILLLRRACILLGRSAQAICCVLLPPSLPFICICSGRLAQQDRHLSLVSGVLFRKMPCG
eukprot:3472178-Pleurochrysis_carterae.AAC.1